MIRALLHHYIVTLVPVARACLINAAGAEGCTPTGPLAPGVDCLRCYYGASGCCSDIALHWTCFWKQSRNNYCKAP
ncbi:hypothetical protein EDC01DRAFT_494380 [Geopyxis carbonaria]|nr:hypothetical protein EDC01DRAFT_494380 [Geopyxis carbonaria]